MVQFDPIFEPIWCPLLQRKHLALNYQNRIEAPHIHSFPVWQMLRINWHVRGSDPGSLTEGLNSLSIICCNSADSVGTSRRGISRFAVSSVGVGFWGEPSVSVVMS